MKKGHNTRSGLLWEVERLLFECNEIGELPQILLMENVPQVHNGKNLPDFEDWIASLEYLGYKNYYQDLNAKDYGIPQSRNRCFMVSILNGERDFKFPEPIPLNMVMKDLLEDEVDEKYYINSDKARELILKLIDNKTIAIKQATKSGYVECEVGGVADLNYPTSKSRYERSYRMSENRMIYENLIDVYNKRMRKDNLCGTLATHPQDGHSGTFWVIEVWKLKEVDEIKSIGHVGECKTQSRTVYLTNGLCPTLSAGMSHGNTIPYILEVCKLEEAKRIGNIYGFTGGNYAGNVYDKNCIAPTLLSMQGGNRQPMIVEVSEVNEKELDPKWIFEVDGEKYYIRIRKLTPKECFRLMGFTDEEFEKAESVNSNTQLYKEAGNSIVVNVLEAIFAELFKEELEELWNGTD